MDRIIQICTIPQLPNCIFEIGILSYKFYCIVIVFVLDNDFEYKHYAFEFVRKNSSSKIQLGSYGIVRAYNKQCISKAYGDITSINVMPYPSI